MFACFGPRLMAIRAVYLGVRWSWLAGGRGTGRWRDRCCRLISLCGRRDSAGAAGLRRHLRETRSYRWVCLQGHGILAGQVVTGSSSSLRSAPPYMPLMAYCSSAATTSYSLCTYLAYYRRLASHRSSCLLEKSWELHRWHSPRTCGTAAKR